MPPRRARTPVTGRHTTRRGQPASSRLIFSSPQMVTAATLLRPLFWAQSSAVRAGIAACAIYLRERKGA